MEGVSYVPHFLTVSLRPAAHSVHPFWSRSWCFQYTHNAPGPAPPSPSRTLLHPKETHTVGTGAPVSSPGGEVSADQQSVSPSRYFLSPWICLFLNPLIKEIIRHVCGLSCLHLAHFKAYPQCGKNQNIILSSTKQNSIVEIFHNFAYAFFGWQTLDCLSLLDRQK